MLKKRKKSLKLWDNKQHIVISKVTSIIGWGAKFLQPKKPPLENSSLQIPPQKNPSSKIPPQENTSQQNISRQNTYQQNTSKNKKAYSWTLNGFCWYIFSDNDVKCTSLITILYLLSLTFYFDELNHHVGPSFAILTLLILISSY